MNTVAAAVPTAATVTGILHSTLTQPANSQKFRTEYHGGPVMAGTSAVYLIWYGNWSSNSAYPIMIDLVSNLGVSNYFKAVTRYPDHSGQAPNSALIYAGSVTLGYEYGSSLSRSDANAMVSGTILAGHVPFDPLGIYVVLTSADVHIDGFGTSWCGYHDLAYTYGMNLKYVLVGNADRAPAVCKPQTGGPNGNSGADAMASHLAALLANTVTDPSLVSWYDRNGLEMAQKCGWTFGPTYQAPNGSLANVRLGQRDFLLQQLWWPTKKGGVCSLAAP